MQNNMYKIIVLNNTKFDITDQCNKMVQFFATRPEPIHVEYSTRSSDISISTKVYKIGQGFDSVTGKPTMVKYLGLADNIKDTCRILVKEGECDAVMFVWDASAVIPSDSTYSNWTNFLPLYANTDFIQIVVNPYMIQQGEVATATKHEPMHAFCYRLNRLGFSVLDEMDIDHLSRSFYHNDQPENPDSNFGETLANIKPYLNKLYIAPKSTYVYFRDSEVVGLKPEFVTLLDQARGLAGVPFIITSGYRDLAHNAAVGGVQDSAHETGLAVDLLVKDGISGEKINAALHQVGIKRFGYYTDGHIHCDIDYSKPNPCYWIK